MKVAIQGVEGCFHQIAANEYFKEAVDFLYCESFPKLVTEVQENKNCNLGIMAIENSIAGSILQNYNLLHQAGLHIIGETYLPIVQNLIALPGTKISTITEVFSHPMAIYQCCDFLNTLPGIKLVEKEDTAGSVKEIKENNLTDRAAIASSLAADIYCMEILAASIETHKNNYTRFLIISPQANKEEATANKASLYFSVPHTTGSLSKVLAVIAFYNINLVKIHSYPIMGENWQYYFYVDLEFDNLELYQKMKEEISSLTRQLKVLGIYKKEININFK